MNKYFNETFWLQSFIKDLNDKYSNKKISYLLWDEDEKQIITQIEDHVKNTPDIILSEMLPCELPDRIAPEEIEKLKDSLLIFNLTPLSRNTLINHHPI